jgi:2,5-diamino-6-(ribosylamino)-4(3H)-pyrimidinone 5'-phosphate reductase
LYRSDAFQELSELIDELRALPAGTSILVEGRKDRTALQRLGVEAPIIQIHSPLPFHRKVSGCLELVILTDYDREGRQLARRYEDATRSLGVKPDLEFRRKLRRATLGEVSHVEGLHTYFTNLKERGVGRRQ